MSEDGCRGDLQTVSFLLPHRPDNSESCKVANPDGPSPWRPHLLASLTSLFPKRPPAPLAPPPPHTRVCRAGPWEPSPWRPAPAAADWLLWRVSAECRGRAYLGGGADVVPPVTRQGCGMGGGLGLLPGQRPTNRRAAEGEDPPHGSHPQEAVKRLGAERRHGD